MRTRACPISWNHPNGPGDRPGFLPLQRAQIVQLACLEPVAKGLHITHWTSQDLARQAVEDGIVPAISDRTVQAILNQVDLQPHRTRYWRTSRIDTHFNERAEKILWCYANAERLARRGFWVVCADEKPNFQVLAGEKRCQEPLLGESAVPWGKGYRVTLLTPFRRYDRHA